MDALMHQIGGANSSSADAAGSRTRTTSLAMDDEGGSAALPGVDEPPVTAEALRSALALLLSRSGRTSDTDADAGPSGQSCSGSDSDGAARTRSDVPAPILDNVSMCAQASGQLSDRWCTRACVQT